MHIYSGAWAKNVQLFKNPMIQSLFLIALSLQKDLSEDNYAKWISRKAKPHNQQSQLFLYHFLYIALIISYKKIQNLHLNVITADVIANTWVTSFSFTSLMSPNMWWGRIWSLNTNIKTRRTSWKAIVFQLMEVLRVWGESEKASVKRSSTEIFFFHTQNVRTR